MDETLPAAEMPTSFRGKRSIKTSTGYLMVLRQGDDVFARLEELAEREWIPSASFVGIGFLSEVTFASTISARRPSIQRPSARSSWRT